MHDVYLRSIEPLIVIVLGCVRWKGPVTSFLFPRYRLQSFKVGADILNQDGMISVISWRFRSLTANSFSN
jgi:hypothetical protein